jgi:hypothetical protein
MPTPTPTPTETNPCIGVGAVFTISATTTPVVTQTPSPTPTPSLQRNINVVDTAYYVIDEGYFECGNVAVLNGCSNNEQYYVSSPILYSGGVLTTGTTFFATIDTQEMCVEYLYDTNGSSSNILNSVGEIYSGCESCELVITPTPSPSPSTTPTPTPSVTPTPSSASVGFSFVFTSCTSNQMIVQSQPLMGLTTGKVVKDVLENCWYYVGQFVSPYTPPPGFIVTNYTNYFGTSYTTFDDCQKCQVQQYYLIGSNFYEVKPTQTAVCNSFTNGVAGLTSYYSTVPPSQFWLNPTNYVLFSYDNTFGYIPVANGYTAQSSGTYGGCWLQISNVNNVQGDIINTGGCFGSFCSNINTNTN